MSDSSANIRIAKNTVFVYVRLFVTIAAGLITSRLVLQALGVNDYGLYNVVGSVVALFSFITASLAGTTQRFINVELGRPDGDPGRIFNICNVIHICSALILFVLIEIIGIVYIQNWLNVAPGKEGDAMFVFQVSAIAACLGISNVPFQSMLTAHERFRDQAAIDIFFTLTKLALVFVLLICSGNLLRIYALFMSITTVASFIIYRLYCRLWWKDTVRWSPVRERGAYREALAFNNYNLLAASANMAKWQGSNVLINYFFGTAVNAGYGIANLATSYIEKFTGNIASAAAPQIIQSQSGNDTERTHYLSHTVTRLSLLIILCIFFTLAAEPDYLLRLWLGDRVPDGTVVFCTYTLILGILGTTTIGLVQVINASGKIKWFKIQFSVLYFLALLVAIPLYKKGSPAYTVLLLYVIADGISRLLFLLLSKTILNYPVWSYIRHSYTRPFAVSAVMLVFLYFYNTFDLRSVLGGLGGTASSGFLVCLLSFFIGLKGSERARILGILRRKTWHRFRKLCYDICPEKALKMDLTAEGRSFNLEHPTDFNDKILWTMCHRISKGWGKYADKLEVRNYVTECGFSELLVPVLGVWKRTSDIDFDSLPEKFVLKCNHDSGSFMVIDKIKGFNADMVRSHFAKALGKKFGYANGEVYYNEIKPLVFAEPLLAIPEGRLSIPDYKVFCFNGKPLWIWTCNDRTAESVRVRTYDTNWNHVEGADVSHGHYVAADEDFPAPRDLRLMLDASARLSKGFPHVRVDFYEADGHLYFGELTFATMAGRIDFFTHDFLLKLGNHYALPTEE